MYRNLVYLFYFILVLEVEYRAPCMLGRHCATRLHRQPLVWDQNHHLEFLVLFFWVSLVTQSGLELQAPNDPPASASEVGETTGTYNAPSLQLILEATNLGPY